jgi:hypothetical protein
MTYKQSYENFVKNWTVSKPKSVDTKYNSFLAQEALLLCDYYNCSYYLLLSLCKTTRSVNKTKSLLMMSPKMAQLYYNVTPAFRLARVENYIKSNPMFALQILILHLAKEVSDGR